MINMLYDKLAQYICILFLGYRFIFPTCIHIILNKLKIFAHTDVRYLSSFLYSNNYLLVYYLLLFIHLLFNLLSFILTFNVSYIHIIYYKMYWNVSFNNISYYYIIITQ